MDKTAADDDDDEAVRVSSDFVGDVMSMYAIGLCCDWADGEWRGGVRFFSESALAAVGALAPVCVSGRMLQLSGLLPDRSRAPLWSRRDDDEADDVVGAVTPA